MRILLVTARYLPHRGGLESVVSHIAREFIRAGHTVLIVTNRYPRTLPAAEAIDGIPVRRLHFLLPNAKYLPARPDLWLAGLWYSFASAHALRQIIHAFRPDVINHHYLNESAEFVARFVGQALPWVVSLHGGDVDGEPFASTKNKQRFSRLTQQATALTACSSPLAAQARALEPALQAITVIHNGVDVPRFQSATPFQAEHPYILAVGQLVAHKGFDLLIEAFARVAAKHPNVQLCIAGSGPQQATLEALLSQNGLSHRFSLPGKVDEATVAALMAGCLFVAMPSQRESFGMVALEAMAAGKAVLAAPVGGLTEFLPVPPNLLVPRSVDAWAATLDKWLTNPPNAEGNQRQAAQHNWPQVAGEYLRVFEQAIHG